MSFPPGTQNYMMFSPFSPCYLADMRGKIFGMYRFDREKDQEAFDRLPERIRRFINDAPILLDSLECERALNHPYDWDEDKLLYYLKLRCESGPLVSYVDLGTQWKLGQQGKEGSCSKQGRGALVSGWCSPTGGRQV